MAVAPQIKWSRRTIVAILPCQSVRPPHTLRRDEIELRMQGCACLTSPESLLSGGEQQDFSLSQPPSPELAVSLSVYSANTASTSPSFTTWPLSNSTARLQSSLNSFLSWDATTRI